MAQAVQLGPTLHLGCFETHKKKKKKNHYLMHGIQIPQSQMIAFNKQISLLSISRLPQRNNWKRHWEPPHTNYEATQTLSTPLFNHSFFFFFGKNCLIILPLLFSIFVYKYLSWKLNWKNNFIIGTNIIGSNKSSLIMVFWKS